MQKPVSRVRKRYVWCFKVGESESFVRGGEGAAAKMCVYDIGNKLKAFNNIA